MVMLGEVLSLATPQGGHHGEISTSVVYRLLENAFAVVVDLNMLSHTDGHTKSQLRSPCTFMQKSLYFANLKLYCI